MIKTEIVNVVATASLGTPIDLGNLTQCAEIVYSPFIYRGKVAYLKTKNMCGKVSIFQSGKMISVGTKSETKAFKELKLAMSFLAERNLAKKIELQPKTQNMVVTADFGVSLDLEKLCETEKAIYEPEQFPGVILKIERPFKTSILLFASGKAVITGLKCSEQIKPTIQQLNKLIESNI